MSGDYRFLPWTRRGLISQVTAQDTLGSAMPARAEFPVRVRVNEATPVGVELSLYGPGDIIGVDPRGIVRLDPRRLASDVEPNYMPAIEFDRPSFPWMFTPAAAGGDGRLRPWCVLIVVRVQDGVEIAQSRQRPLPTLTISGQADARSELPDLAESWAWAHTQVITEEDSSGAIEANLRNEPSLNASRIICPRRLEPDRRYYACLVPAFAVGVAAGLGQPVSDDADLTPAWSPAQREVELPVYYHWEFGTGAGGDFESLARKLEPPSEPLDVGTSRMFIGAADPGLPALDAADDAATITLEGALVSPDHKPPNVVGDIPEALRTALAAMLDAPHDAAGGDDHLALPVAPPLYGRWHAGQHVVPEDTPRWLRELNLDPRYRAVAGLGAEIVRANQEELMHDAWKQVGDVRRANHVLNLARFAAEAAVRLHLRALVPLDVDRLVRMTAPLHGRVLVGDSTVRRRVHESIVPDAAEDPAFRRITSRRSATVRRAVRRTATPGTPGHVAIIDSINRGAMEANPTKTLPDAIVAAAALGALDVPGDGDVDLEPIGGKRPVAAALLRSVTSHVASLGTPPPPSAVRARPNLSKTGVVVRTHFDKIAGAGSTDHDLVISATLDAMVAVADDHPNAAGFLLLPEDQGVAPIDVDRSGIVTVRAARGEPSTVLGTIAADVGGVDAADIDEFLAAGRIDPIGPPSAPPIAPPIAPPVPPLPPVPPVPPVPPRPPVTPPRPPVTPPVTPPRLVKQPDVIRRVRQALTAHVDALQPPAVTVPEPNPLALDAVRTELLAKTDPARVVPHRIAAMVRIAEHSLGSQQTQIVRGGTGLGPLHASPQLHGPMYEPLAAYAPERLLPGVERIEANTVGLLKTNPRFVEAFLIGANIELAHEFSWREYPAQRGITPLRHFWARDDGSADIPPITDFKRGVKLGSSALGGPDGQIVFLIRGDLLRRYPTTAVYAVRAAANGRLSKAAADHREPILRGFIDPDIAFVGFDLTRDEVLADPGFFFVLQQQATEPRFGFDVPATDDSAVPSRWRDATWTHVAVVPGGHLIIDGNPMAGVERDGARFADNSAHLAAIALQQPVRVAIHAEDLIPGDGA